MIHHRCCCHRPRRVPLGVAWHHLNTRCAEIEQAWAQLRAQARAERAAWPPIRRGRLILVLALLALTVALLALA